MLYTKKHYSIKSKGVKFQIRLFKIACVLVYFFLSATAHVNSAKLINEAPSFDSSVPEHTKSGFFKLSWAFDKSEDARFRIVESTDPSFGLFKLKYEGPDLATFVSGLPDGIYYYRVRAFSDKNSWVSPWSETLGVTVEHHSLKLATTLLIIGAVVFISTLILILYGNFKFNKN